MRTVWDVKDSRYLAEMRGVASEAMFGKMEEERGPVRTLREVHLRNVEGCGVEWRNGSQSISVVKETCWRGELSGH